MPSKEDLTALADRLYQKGVLLHRAKKLADAEKIYREILKYIPHHFGSLHLLGVVNGQRGNLGESLKFFDLAVAIDPTQPVIHFNRGNAQKDAGFYQDALASFSTALKLKPEFPAAFIRRAQIYQKLGHHDEAEKNFSSAIKLEPENPDFRREAGEFFLSVGRPVDASVQLEAALALRPNNPAVLCKLADSYRNSSKLAKALDYYNAAIRHKSDCLEAHYGRGIILQAFKQYEEAIVSYEQAARMFPCPKRLLGRLILCRLMIGDWRNLANQKRQLVSQIQSGQHATTPFAALSIIQNPDLLLKCNQLYINDLAPSKSHNKRFRLKSKTQKIRLGYFSSDFRTHPVSQLLVGLLENHDRSRFETIGVDICPAPGDESTKRIAAALDRFVSIGLLSPRESISRSESLELDIAIDLNGLTFGAKPEIFANRVAPVQVSYLGFPGTSGAHFYDYLIGDRVVIPKNHFSFYTEKIAFLKHSYLPNDSRKEISKTIPTKESMGLPSKGFIFCCFNNSYKISPDVFNVWMRILKSVEGSVLWLSEMNPTAVRNLTREAADAGINPDRLLFAPRTPSLADHLSRHRLADLFLDTLPYNAHTTACDSLWAGVPVLTCLGESFAGRVAASLLHAIELPELVCTTLEHYEEIAIDIARRPERLAALKKKLRLNRMTKPLFHSKGYAQNMESLYQTMWTRHQNGIKPDHIGL